MNLRIAFANCIGASPLIPSRLRVIIYRLAGIGIHLRSWTAPAIYFRTSNITMGRNSSINHGCVFDNRALVKIGSNVGVGAGVKFITSNHEMEDPRSRAGAGSVHPIEVRDGAWIGSAAVVLGGVTIGQGAVVAAGAIVRRDVPNHELWGGVPARFIRSLPQAEESKNE
ncbi:acyltransferase [Rhodococcus sp. A14]|nr:acyltransferase [Rhodococcus sp. A14]